MPTKVFSLAVAIIVWVVIIASQQTPYQFTDEIEVKAFNMPENLSLISSLPKVKIKIVTTKDILQTLTKSDFEAYIDTKNIKEGMHTLDVLVTPKIQNVTVVAAEPSRVSFEVENMMQRQVAIKAVISGSLNTGYKAEKPVLSLDKAQVEGAESLIKKVSELRAEIIFDGSESVSLEKEIKLKAFDQSGVEIKEVKITPENIKVNISIMQVTKQKAVGIKASVKGSPKTGWIEKITLEPSTIEVKGDAKYIDALDYLDTEDFDVSEIIKTTEKYLLLNIPKNVSLVNENANRVKVTVEFKPYNK
ncbi:MAG: CdaR family protein [Candidatus Gracilibacteria bacterium]